MSQSGELQYYENPSLWTRETFLENDKQLSRFATCANLIPANVRSLLDVGAGNGAFLSFLENRGSSISLAGLERSETAINSAVCQAKIHHGSAENTPCEDQAFDLVSLMEVIEHLPYGVYERTLREAERIARDYILVSVPYKEKRVKVKCPYCSCQFHPNYHMRRFDEEIASGLFEAFRSSASRKVTVQDYVFEHLWNKGHRAIFGRNEPFPSTALCPQCGFHSFDRRSRRATALPKAKRLRELVKQVLPRQNRTIWLVVLYKRAY